MSWAFLMSIWLSDRFVCRSAFAPVHTPSRLRDKPDGGSHSHAENCVLVAADMIEDLQLERHEQHRKRSYDEAFEYELAGTMLDETKLHVKADGDGSGRRSGQET